MGLSWREPSKVLETAGAIHLCGLRTAQKVVALSAEGIMGLQFGEGHIACAVACDDGVIGALESRFIRGSCLS